MSEPLLALFGAWEAPVPLAAAQATPEDELRIALPPEEETIVRAVDKRKREFRAGRAAARRALAALGAPAVAIPVGTRREPGWPEGVVGAITHTQGFCAAVVGWKARARGLGLDAEPKEALPPDVERLILTPEEDAELAELFGEQQAIARRLLFSAKESVHKCIFPETTTTLDFLDVAIRFAPDPGRGLSGGRVTAEPTPRAPEIARHVASFEGWYTTLGETLVTAMRWLP